MKQLFLLAMLCLTTFANAQFKITKDGIISEDDKKYIVVKVDSISAQELFNRVERYCLANYVNPDCVMNKQPYNMINISGLDKYAFEALNGIGNKHADIRYNIVILFKDNRIRINAPTIEHITIENSLGKNEELMFDGSVFLHGKKVLFKSNGNINNKKAVNNMTKWINNKIKGLIDFVQNDNNLNSEDW